MGVLRAKWFNGLQKLSFSRWFPLLVSLLAGLVVVAFSLSGLLDPFERVLYDWRFSQRSDLAPSGRVAVVDINNATLRDMAEIGYGRWPWSRELWGAFQKTVLYSAKTRGTVYDVVFDLPDVNPDADLIFAEWIRNSGNVFLACLFVQSDPGAPILNEPEEDSAEWKLRREYMDKFPLRLEARVEAELHDRLLEYDNAILPLTPLMDAVFATGSPTYQSDPDGVVRRFPLIHYYRGKLFPSLPLMAALNDLGVSLDAIRVIPGRFILVPLSSESTLCIPIDEQAQMLVNYRSPKPSIYHSINFSKAFRLFADWQDSKVQDPFSALKDRTVVIGSTAEATEDIRSIPGAEKYPMTFTVATVIDNILKGDFLRESHWSIDACLMLLNAFLIGIWNIRVRPSLRLLLTLLQTVVLVYIDFQMFGRFGFCVPLAGPLMSIAVPFTAVVLLKYTFERNARRYAESAFGKYVDPTIVKELIQNPENIGLGGVSKNVTILFSDICSFTTLSEAMTSEQVVTMLNEYFEEMSLSVKDHGGIVDKYHGDAIMVVFGLPTAHPDDPLRAVRCALGMLERLEQRKQGAHPGYFSNLNIRIGINSGQVTAGNIGSQQKQQYTVIGDAVNTASRLETLAPRNRILISDTTYSAVCDEIEVKDLGKKQVKGKQIEVNVYEVLGLKENAEKINPDSLSDRADL